MFDLEKLKASFKGANGVKVAFDEAEVDTRPAALVTVLCDETGKTARRVFTESDLASPKLAAQVERFCKQVLP